MRTGQKIVLGLIKKHIYFNLIRGSYKFRVQMHCTSCTFFTAGPEHTDNQNVKHFLKYYLKRNFK